MVFSRSKDFEVVSHERYRSTASSAERVHIALVYIFLPYFRKYTTTTHTRTVHVPSYSFSSASIDRILPYNNAINVNVYVYCNVYTYIIYDGIVLQLL